MDRITLDRIKLIHDNLYEELSTIYAEICEALDGRAECRFTHTLRTFEEQDALYAQGRTKPGKIVTRVRGGDSYHNYGLAVDIVLLVDGKASWDIKTDYDKDGRSDWMEVVDIFKRYGWEWGGDWKFFDAPHFQKSKGYTIAKLKSLWKANRVFKAENGHKYVHL
jgi:peptidoglycan L-alanyl-D-glutamate endopeptidase CwlK